MAGRGRGPEHTTEEEQAEEPKPLKVCLDFWYPARRPSKKKEEEQRANEEEEKEEEGSEREEEEPGKLDKSPALVLFS